MNVDDEAKQRCNEYMRLCMKYAPKFMEMSKAIAEFKRECPADACCMNDGTVEALVEAINEMQEWCEGTMDMTPEDFAMN